MAFVVRVSFYSTCFNQHVNFIMAAFMELKINWVFSKLYPANNTQLRKMFLHYPKSNSTRLFFRLPRFIWLFYLRTSWCQGSRNTYHFILMWEFLFRKSLISFLPVEIWQFDTYVASSLSPLWPPTPPLETLSSTLIFIKSWSLNVTCWFTAY